MIEIPSFRKAADSITVRVYMAGDYAHAKILTNQWCQETPGCIMLHPCDYIYTGGQEAGFVATFINYPRFADDRLGNGQAPKIRDTAKKYAEFMRVKLNQGSYTIDAMGEMRFYSVRPQDENLKE